jgi:hypothetical protein
LLTGTPVADLILICPGVNFKSIERNALSADRDLSDIGPDFNVETIPVHPKIGWGVP